MVGYTWGGAEGEEMWLRASCSAVPGAPGVPALPG